MSLLVSQLIVEDDASLMCSLCIMKNFLNVFINEKHVLRLSSVTFYSFCKKLINSHYIRCHKDSELQILTKLCILSSPGLY